MTEPERKARTVTEYRLLVQRAGNPIKERRFRSMKPILRRIAIMTSPEPWRFYDDDYKARRGPDDFVCCSGRECGCGGMTMREETDERRKDLPPIESIRVDARTVTTTPWQRFESPELLDAVVPVDASSRTGSTRVKELSDV